VSFELDKTGVSVMFDEKWGTVVTPVEKPGWKAPGPILQITCSNTIYKPSTLDYTSRSVSMFAPVHM
jgi:hypothetical protein